MKRQFLADAERLIEAAAPTAEANDLRRHVETLLDVVDGLHAEEGERGHWLMMSLLKKTILILRGPEPEQTSWSWHDIPERVEALMRYKPAAERLAQALRAHLASPHKDVDLTDGHTAGFCLRCADLYEEAMKALSSYADLPVGRWQRQMPENPGLYWIRTLNGEAAGTTTVVEINGKLLTPSHLPPGGSSLEVAYEGTSWGGWFWSEPIPEPPPFHKK